VKSPRASTTSLYCHSPVVTGIDRKLAGHLSAGAAAAEMTSLIQQLAPERATLSGCLKLSLQQAAVRGTRLVCSIPGFHAACR
jgi:hypothetical protein